MVLPVSGFLPVPLPMMIPFMGAQSLVIGKMFGEGFQYGKRKISAMPNEEFNKLTFETMMSNARDEMQASIPTMIQAMQDMKPMVAAVIHEFTNYLSLVIQAAPDTAGQVVTDIAHTIAPHEGEQIPAGHTEELNIFETIAEQFPHIHEAGATDLQQKITIPLNRGFTTGGSQAFDTSGQSLAEFNRLKAVEAARLVAARANRPKQIQQFGSTKIKAQVSRDVTKRPAGQSAKKERLLLINEINKWTLKWKQEKRIGIKNAWAKNIKHNQQLLTNLLARFRF